MCRCSDSATKSEEMQEMAKAIGRGPTFMDLTMLCRA